MLDQTDRILSEIFEDKEFTETHTLYFESFEENTRRSEKLRQRDVDENRSSTIKKIMKFLFFFSQQLRNAEMTMLRLYNLQRARLLKQQVQDITTRVQALRNNSTEFESFKIFKLRNANAQSTTAHSMIFKNLNNTVIDTLLLQILLSFKFKIIKFEKIRTYKDQNENGYQR